jgi:tubulin polyglutamylase TTLL11
MHLTNYSLNKRSSKFVHTDEITEINEGTKQTVTSCYAQLRRMGYDTDDINQQIDKCVAKTLYAALPCVRNQADRYINEHNLKQFKGFHILGFDMLLDDQGTPYLLEVNSSPSLDINYEIEIRPGVTETHLSELDYYVKRSVVEDAVNLVFSKGRNTGRYRLVLPNYYDFKDDMRIFDSLFTLFRKLCDRSYSYIPASKFRKLSSLLQISCNDLDIIYSQISRRNDTSRLDYNLFITTLVIFTLGAPRKSSIH